MADRIANTSIVLRVSPREFFEISGIQRFDDGSECVSQLSVASGRFFCTGHSFYFDNLPRFTTDIREAYDGVEGKARLNYRYETDFIEIEVQKLGRVSVSGFLAEYGPLQQELRFAFECDQTFLPALLRSLEQVSAELGDTR